jgi:hypothetical protein
MGARDMEKPRPPVIDGGSSPLMWHAALQVADYNRDPAALDLMRQGADTWLRFMRVTIIELQQLEKLEPISRRADLALAARETEVRDGQIHGVVHNLGAANVDEVVVPVVDASGKVLQRQSLGVLPAPLDLIPKRKSFAMPLPGRPQAGWRLIVDPDQRIPELYEGNNVVALK